MGETVWERKYPSERKFIAWNHCWPMARLSAVSKLRRFTWYNTRLQFKESLKALIFWTHLCSVSSLVSVVNPSSPFSCNLLPAWRASPHWPAAGNPKLSTVTNTPTVIRNSPAAPTPLPSSYFLNLSESQPTKVSHIHLISINIQHLCFGERFCTVLCWGEKRKAEARAGPWCFRPLLPVTLVPQASSPDLHLYVFISNS